MNTPSCPSPEDLRTLVLGKSSTPELRQHVSSCADCQRRLKRLHGPAWLDLKHASSELTPTRADIQAVADSAKQLDVTSLSGQLPTFDPGLSPPPPLVREMEWPTRIGPFLVQEKIGQGGMGVVLRARDPDFNRNARRAEHGWRGFQNANGAGDGHAGLHGARAGSRRH